MKVISITASLQEKVSKLYINYKGKWIFPDENVAEGEYKQEKEEKDDDQGVKKIEVKLAWKTAADVVKSAEKVNSCEALNY